jgi:hypothetical protein
MLQLRASLGKAKKFGIGEAREAASLASRNYTANNCGRKAKPGLNFEFLLAWCCGISSIALAIIRVQFSYLP